LIVDRECYNPALAKPFHMQVLIVKLSSIGDVVHTLPAAALLRRALPDAHIAWVVERRASAILKDSPVIDELIEIDSRAWRKDFFRGAGIGEFRERLGQLRDVPGVNGSGRADIALDFQGLIKSGLLAFVSRAKRRIGFETDELRETPSRVFLTEQIETAELKHVIEKNLALARAAVSDSNNPTSQMQPTPGGYEFPIAVSTDDEKYVDEIIENRGVGFGIINPGGGWPTKLWPSELYAQLADWLWSDCGLASFVTYGPGEEVLAQRVADRARSGAARPIASTLKQYVALARRASLFIGGDTGPLHLAAASGTPIVGLYGPTSAERNGPFDHRDITVGRDLWCRAECHRRSCWHWECMNIPLSEVQRAIVARLSGAVEKRR
jgi:lipopolysaccharide heptosyltransferase I